MLTSMDCPCSRVPTCVWPILGVLKEVTNCQPFIIGIFCGSSKPGSLDEFLEDFVRDVQSVEVDGLSINGKHYAFTIGAFICDAQARTFLKGTFRVF